MRVYKCLRNKFQISKNKISQHMTAKLADIPAIIVVVTWHEPSYSKPEIKIPVIPKIGRVKSGRERHLVMLLSFKP